MLHASFRMSCVMCHVSRSTCHMSGVTFFFRQSGEAYRWRVCYQRGLPRQVYDCKHHFQPLERGGAVQIFSQTIS